jgi:hypothetical protein
MENRLPSDAVDPPPKLKRGVVGAVVVVVVVVAVAVAVAVVDAAF